MTINVSACLIVFLGSFMGTSSPLTVTQMLWVNLIMDTFAAMALASLPPSADVMKSKPRHRNDFIITRPMWQAIMGLGLLFTVLLLGLVAVFQHSTFGPVGSESLFQFAWSSEAHEMTIYQGAVFFTLFVMLQFWNMFNAKAFLTGHSAFHGLLTDRGFLFVSVFIVLGQILIVSLGGQMFQVCPLSLTDWALIIGSTSIILWAGELVRALQR